MTMTYTQERRAEILGENRIRKIRRTSRLARDLRAAYLLNLRLMAAHNAASKRLAAVLGLL